ncbi:histidinol-phosphatase [bacterium]|nr:histidinol-phosphatase [bacterium]
MELFKNGSKWLKADFHLHTLADTEFVYKNNCEYPEKNTFPNDFVERLSQQDIRIGVITNHNKFDFEEFKSISKKAKQKDIFILPGVELSINEGANGIHTLIVFSEHWIENGKNYISSFLTSMFPSKTESEYNNENGRSEKNLLQVIEELNKTSRDYFLVFAHVEQSNGLWKELSGGRLKDLSEPRYSSLRQRTLGFQKVRTNDLRVKVKSWLGDWYPAEVEGSDSKKIEDIGDKSGETWIKVGDYSFEAVKYALIDYKNRLLNNKPDEFKHSYIESISFTGGLLDQHTLNFSPELNSLIGIRGSGKSSVIEAIRYALDIHFGDKAIDKSYKERLLNYILKSGGKVSVIAKDRLGNKYEISRVLNEAPEVFINEKLNSGISITKTIIHKPIYFGQKDLSSTGEGFEKDLVEILVEHKLIGIREEIEIKKNAVIGNCIELEKLSDVDNKIKDTKNRKKDAEYRLKIYKDNGIENKLKEQSSFESDLRKIQGILASIENFNNDLKQVIDSYEDDLKNQTLHKSKHNSDYFDDFFSEYSKIISNFDNLKSTTIKIDDIANILEKKKNDFENLKKSKRETFEEVRRKLEVELHNSGKSLDLEEFPKIEKAIETTTQLLKSLEEQQNRKQELRLKLKENLSELNKLYHREFSLIKEELDKINIQNSSLRIEAQYKGDKDAFLKFFKEAFRGSKIWENSLQNIVQEYSDFSAISNDIENVLSSLTSSSETFKNYFYNNIKGLLTWQVPNKFTITYRGKELIHHSLGQRASALILFVLSQNENDLIIIDQPEDDLDNQTIYEEVIKLLKTLKVKTQFIFATHNANFPVLGDSEKIFSFKYEDEKITFTEGSIDSPLMQHEIVDIMEGGEDAFNKRKEIYNIWKPLS